MSQTPRHINTDRSLKRPERAADAPRHAASSTDAKQSTGGAHNEPPRRPAQGSGQNEPPRRRNKKKKTPLWLPFAVVMAIIAVISGVVVYGVSLLNKVEDSIRPDDSTPTIEEEVKTDEEYKGDVVNILVCGIDYEEGPNYSNDPTSNDGMTDMILYVQFDIKNGALRMLQIPRNSLVTTKNKKITLSNGKTYAATNYQINSVAISNGGSIAALADVIYDQFRLPIDYYVTVDMQALVDMVDNFGGIEVYIPHDMSYGGSKLLKGYRSSNIILAQTPVFMGVPNVGKTDTFAGYSCVVPDAGSIANLLNQYFCTYTGPIDVSEMNLVTDEWPHGSASTDANVQYMGRIDKESDDAILSGDTDLDGAVTTDGQAAGSAN